MKRTKWIAAALCIALFFSGCAKEQDQEKHIFGATYMTRNNPYFDVLNDEIAEGIEANGDKLIVRDPLQDQEKQNQQILDMIDEGIEILFLNPVDKVKVKPALKACQEAGVEIINIDTQVDDMDYVLSTIETDNYQAGQECAKDMMKRVDSARIIILDNPMQDSIVQRVQGFLDTIEGHPEYQVVQQIFSGGEIEISAEVVSGLLDEDFNVVFGGNDPSALGALAALQKAGREEGILIYGVDGSPDFKAMLDMGYVTGTSSQSPETIGKTATEMAYQALDGKSVEKYVKLPSRLITKENLMNYDIDGWQ